MTDDDDATGYGPDLFGLYLDEIGHYPLLSKEDEERLGRAVMAGQEARKVLESGAKLTAKRKKELAATVAAGKEAAELFVNSNLRLVVSVARRHHQSGIPMSDLVQEGNIGLAHAVEKFDWRMGFKFSTYAVWWIRQAIGRAIENTSHTVRVPAHVGDEIRNIRRVQQDMESETGRPPSLAELADATGKAPERLVELFRIDSDPSSLDMQVGEDGWALGDFVADASAEDAFTAVDTSDRLARLLACLSGREHEVVSLRYGLGGRRPQALEDVGRLLGCSRASVANIERVALAKLRKAAVASLEELPAAV